MSQQRLSVLKERRLQVAGAHPPELDKGTERALELLAPCGNAPGTALVGRLIGL